jgi:UDP-N-acetylenolpyruvoylglucosamine reductase
VDLAREIAAGVHDAFGLRLVPEPVFVGHAWEPVDRIGDGVRRHS